MKFATIARRTLAAAIVFGVVWAVMVLVWRRNDASPGPGDLGLYLLALPVGLIGGYWLLRWGIDARKAKATAATTDATDADADSVDAPPPPDRVLHLLASALLLPAGANAAEVVAALAEPKRPGLHPQLKDESGMPVFAAPVEGIDPDAVAEALRAVVADSERLDRPDVDEVFAEEHLRALALLDPVAEELLQAALPPPGEDLDPYAAAVVTAPESVLRVRLLLAQSWPLPARQLAADWLQAKALALGYRDGEVAVEAVPVTAAADVWRLLDLLAQTQAREPDRDRHLLLSAHCLLTEAGLEHLSQHQQLLGSGRPEGVIPGEGAAGVLLSAPAPAPPDGALPLRVHRLSQAPALTGVAHRRVIAHAGKLITRALATATQPADTVTAVLSDGDHRPSRAVELAGAIAAVFPDLDPIQHGLHLGIACGDLGAVAPLALLAAAAAQAEQTAAPVLAISVADDALRVALAVSPLPPLIATDSPATPASALAQPA